MVDGFEKLDKAGELISALPPQDLPTLRDALKTINAAADEAGRKEAFIGEVGKAGGNLKLIAALGAAADVPADQRELVTTHIDQEIRLSPRVPGNEEGIAAAVKPKITATDVKIKEQIDSLSLKDRQLLNNTLALEPSEKTLDGATKIIEEAAARAENKEAIVNIVTHYSKSSVEDRKAITGYLDSIGMAEFARNERVAAAEPPAGAPVEPPPPLPKVEIPKPTQEELDLLRAAKAKVGKNGKTVLDDAKAFSEEASKWTKYVGENRIKSPAVPLVLTVATLALPNEKVPQEDGTEKEKWGTGKKIAFGAGSVLTVGTVGAGHKWGGYLKLAKAEAKAAAHDIKI